MRRWVLKRIGWENIDAEVQYHREGTIYISFCNKEILQSLFHIDFEQYFGRHEIDFCVHDYNMNEIFFCNFTYLYFCVTFATI